MIYSTALCWLLGAIKQSRAFFNHHENSAPFPLVFNLVKCRKVPFWARHAALPQRQLNPLHPSTHITHAHIHTHPHSNTQRSGASHSWFYSRAFISPGTHQVVILTSLVGTMRINAVVPRSDMISIVQDRD